jgi:hypothetical protein
LFLLRRKVGLARGLSDEFDAVAANSPQHYSQGRNLLLLDHPKMRQRHLLSVTGFDDQFSVSVAVGDDGMSGSFSAATAGNSCCEFALTGNLS